jgi:hypothetical protein
MGEERQTTHGITGWQRVRIGEGAHSVRVCIHRGQTAMEELEEMRHMVKSARATLADKTRHEGDR